MTAFLFHTTLGSLFFPAYFQFLPNKVSKSFANLQFQLIPFMKIPFIHVYLELYIYLEVYETMSKSPIKYCSMHGRSEPYPFSHLYSKVS